ncbi:hypothetical protein JXC34_03825 [Candidatus Woesearchaeota archaeon]|nr:hypothetical protein [Candidatus Woesearchaeota archaeon]
MKSNNRIFQTKKAQLAVETLLIYGIALLVVMGAVFALIQFGVLDLGSMLPDQCDLGEFSCENYVVKPDLVQLELRNNLPKNLENMTVNIEGTGDNEGLWNCDPAVYTDLVVKGEVTNPPVEITCDIKVPKGKKIEGVVYIEAKLIGSNILKSIQGKIRTSVS